MKSKVKEQVITSDLRQMLKAMMQKELEKLPEALKDLEPLQRLSILCKLLPFVLPKVESVNPSYNEPNEWGL